jgi:hypothetical protein
MEDGYLYKLWVMRLTMSQYRFECCKKTKILRMKRSTAKETIRNGKVIRKSSKQNGETCHICCLLEIQVHHTRFAPNWIFLFFSSPVCHCRRTLTFP